MPQLFIDNRDSRAREVALAVRNTIEEADAEELRQQEWLEQQKQAHLRPGFRQRLWKMFFRT